MRADLDVAVLGGGLAGNLLARQLRRRLPGLRVALFERSRERGYKVGESTVEIATMRPPWRARTIGITSGRTTW